MCVESVWVGVRSVNTHDLAVVLAAANASVCFQPTRSTDDCPTGVYIIVLLHCWAHYNVLVVPLLPKMTAQPL